MTKSSGTFLTEQEIQELTGCRVRNLQTRWLASRRWPFELDHYKRPVVLRSVMECKIGDSDATQDGFTLDEADVA